MLRGRKAVVGGGRHGDKGYFVKPTVLVNTNEKMKVVREEIFGPVVTAIPFNDLRRMVTQANDTVYGLAAGIWTRDIQKAHRLASQLRAGTVWINCYNIFDAALPFGGYKQSGWGREMGHDVLELYTEVKQSAPRCSLVEQVASGREASACLFFIPRCLHVVFGEGLSDLIEIPSSIPDENVFPVSARHTPS